MKTNWQEVEELAQRAGFKNYGDYLFSDHWRNLRESKLAESNYCCVCFSLSPLAVHHIRYHRLIDVCLSDLAVICMQHHDIFHMACRRNRIDYLGLQVPGIIKTTLEFQETEWCKKWIAKKSLRKESKGSPQPKTGRCHIRKRFRGFIRNPTKQAAQEFCAWLLDQF